MILRYVADTFERMPWLLRIASGASLVLGLVFPVITLIPSATFQIGSESLSGRELWTSGVAWAIWVVSPMMLVTGLGVVFKRRWVRPVLIVLPFLQTLPFQAVHVATGAPNPAPDLKLYIIGNVVWALLMSLYLFGYRPAREHFAHVRA